MQEGVMQSFVLIPGWVLADPLLSPPRTVGTISHISTAEFPCYGLPIFWRDKEASTNLILLPSPVFPWREERYPGQRAHWAQQTHYTRTPGTVSRLWIESSQLFSFRVYCWAMIPPLKRYFWGAHTFPIKEHRQGSSSAMYWLQLLHCWACEVEIKTFLEFQALKQADRSQGDYQGKNAWVWNGNHRRLAQGDKRGKQGKAAFPTQIPIMVLDIQAGRIIIIIPILSL